MIERNRKNDSNNLMKNSYYEHGYALLIGIRYGHWKKLRPLEGTLNDVNDIAKHFKDTTKAAYKPENVIEITEEKATAKGILNGLDSFITKVNADKDASVLIFYAGHGETDGSNYFLLPYDFDIQLWYKNRTFDRDRVILSNQFANSISKIQAKKSLIILDCCHSENIPVTRNLNNTLFLNGFVESLDETVEISNRGFSKKKLAKGSGLVILTSCAAHEKALDIGTNGLFTRVLLDCLNGKKNIEKDGWVRLTDIIHYVPKEVKERAQSYRHHQNPVFKRIENLSAEDYIISAYDIAYTRGISLLENNPVESPLEIKENMTKEKILQLINEDLDAALDELDNIFGKGNGIYNDFVNEYITPSNNFNRDYYRRRLIRFVRRSSII